MAEIVGEFGDGGGAHPVGRERYGLQNDEVALANRIVTFPVNAVFAWLNLAQAVLLMGYEWFKLSTDGALPFAARTIRAGAAAADAGVLRHAGPSSSTTSNSSDRAKSATP